MTIDFSKILQKQASAIEKPKPLPVGHYVVNNPQLPKFQGIGKNDTPAATFNLVIISPLDDVDQADLQAYGEYKGKSLRTNMFLTENSEFRTKEELLNVFGLEDDGTKTLGQLFNETIGRQCVVEIEHIPTSDGTDIIHQVKKLSAV